MTWMNKLNVLFECNTCWEMRVWTLNLFSLKESLLEIRASAQENFRRKSLSSIEIIASKLNSVNASSKGTFSTQLSTRRWIHGFNQNFHENSILYKLYFRVVLCEGRWTQRNQKIDIKYRRIWKCEFHENLTRPSHYYVLSSMGTCNAKRKIIFMTLNRERAWIFWEWKDVKFISASFLRFSMWWRGIILLCNVEALMK